MTVIVVVTCVGDGILNINVNTYIFSCILTYQVSQIVPFHYIKNP